MYKKHSLILLPTDEKSNIILSGFKTLFLSPPMEVKSSDTFQNLYVLSNDEIKIGDWFIFADAPEFTGDLPNYKIIKATKNHKEFGCKKIIATTNTSLFQTTQYEIEGNQKIQLPQIPFLFIQHYIEQYNLGNVITEVEVEYEIWNVFSGDHNNTPQEISLKLNSNNTISIKPLKNSWTREEVIKYGKLAFEVGRNFQLTGENNLKKIENKL